MGALGCPLTPPKGLFAPGLRFLRRNSPGNTLPKVRTVTSCTCFQPGSGYGANYIQRVDQFDMRSRTKRALQERPPFERYLANRQVTSSCHKCNACVFGAFSPRVDRAPNH